MESLVLRVLVKSHTRVYYNVRSDNQILTIFLAITYPLMTMTIPDWQWFACAQYINMGSVFVTGITKVPTMPLAPPSKGMKPLLMPVPEVAGWQGVDASLCVTVWFRAANWNWITSPGCAVMEFGVKERLLPPTSTGIRRVVEDKVLWDTRLSNLSGLVLATIFVGGLYGDRCVRWSEWGYQERSKGLITNTETQGQKSRTDTERGG